MPTPDAICCMLPGHVVSAAGQYQGDAGKSACIECRIGYYNPSEAQDRCVPCAAGTFASTTGLSVCSSCEAGKSQPETGQSSCLICEPGTYSKPGTYDCLKCEKGTYATTGGNSACEACAAGKSQPLVWQSECVSCQPGTYSPGPGHWNCTNTGHTRRQAWTGTILNQTDTDIATYPQMITIDRWANEHNTRQPQAIH